MALGFVIFLITVALFFDFINGFHDAANSIATIVSTRVLKPWQAVLWAAFFNFVAFLFFETRVASTIGSGLIDTSVVEPALIFSALVGAVAWNLITWFYGIPSSSSHALVGGLVGSGISKSGFAVVKSAGLTKIVASIFISPVLGLFLGFVLMKLARTSLAARTPYFVDHWFRKFQLISAALYSLGHGGNDAQKTMGLIAVLLFSSGYLGNTFHVPFWVVILCHIAMAMGTLFGGWRIVKTMGSQLTKLNPLGGFCAESSGAATLFLATHFGIPVSTTHTITGSIIGVGSAKSLSAVRWHHTSKILIAWVITLPAVGILSSLTWLLTHELLRQ